jgi:hypothetical protein
VFTQLLGLDYRVVHKKGIENGVTDALSGRLASQAECYAISESRHKWLELVVASYEHDSAAQDMITKHAVDGDSVPHFALINGLLSTRVECGLVPIKICISRLLLLCMILLWEGGGTQEPQWHIEDLSSILLGRE